MALLKRGFFHLLAFSLLSHAVGEPNNKHQARSLLGNSFGTPNVNATYDYIVVGGGNAGLTIAARLSEDPTKSVAVIEAGSFYEITNGNHSELPSDDIYWAGKSPLDVNPLVDWNFTTTPQAGVDDAVVHYPRGKTLGGCTARNYMAYHRGTKSSYQMWADAVGDESYTWDNLLPHFKHSLTFTPPDVAKRGLNATPLYDEENLAEGGQPLPVTWSNYAQAFSTWVQEGLKQIGIFPRQGFTSGELLGSSFQTLTIHHDTGARASSETAFLRPAMGRDNLIVYVDTLATRVVFEGKDAVAVEVDTQGFQYTLSAKKEIILSAGAFQSPQLLMVSGVGPRETLEEFDIPVVADRPGVGQNMWDHILFGPSWRVDVITASALSNTEKYYEAVEEFRNEQDGLLASNGGDFLAWEKLPSSLKSNWSSETKEAFATFPDDWPDLEYLSVGAYFGYQQNFVNAPDGPKDDYNYATMAMGLITPLSRGNISIQSPDMRVQPLINPNWLSHPGDQAMAVAAYKRVRQLFETPKMKEILIGDEYFPGPSVQTDDELLALIRKSFGTIFHPAATCAMGKLNDTMAVVDSKAKVIGVNKLRVVDASAFPFLPPGHPVATVYMLAEKIASEIRSS
ncbi:GMC oxidoreductase [Aplosporella prunicola CBS 121167]|uniref:GMC oxidoreductase n=1 Tax=Aplosporella prunicola CBS 121167 TaxID=1176127 RepID=A0A6A6AWG1_9PEZI|nr:GMC oxidoreductase [Aplosporella prunicola CBS 121167]KAF2135598.1 GMC oxidoreductase [Aplosporella prunicola CBS 121167]